MMDNIDFDIEGSEKNSNSEAVKNLRKSTGLSQRAFSEKYGIPQRTLQEWEGGRRNPPAYVLRMLSMYVKYYELMKDDMQGDE